MNGRVAKIPIDPETNSRRGFGFIVGADGARYFFHASAMQMTGRLFAEVREGNEVTFTPIDGPQGKGPRAIEVRVL